MTAYWRADDRARSGDGHGREIGGWTRSAGEDARGRTRGGQYRAPTPTAQARRCAEALSPPTPAAHGLRVIARATCRRGGEVDLVCLDRSHVVFVEVRLRRNNRFGGAADAITAAKRRRALIAAQWWLGGAGRLSRLPLDFAVLLDALDRRASSGSRGVRCRLIARKRLWRPQTPLAA